MSEVLPLAIFICTFAVLLSGYPVAFCLAGTALAFAGLGLITGHFDAAFFSALPVRVYGIMTNETLVAVPLFVFMGVVLERSKIAEDLLETMALLCGGLRGGLGISVCIVGGRGGGGYFGFASWAAFWPPLLGSSVLPSSPWD